MLGILGGPSLSFKTHAIQKHTSVYCKGWLGGPALSVCRYNEDERGKDTDVMVESNFSMSGDDAAQELQSEQKLSCLWRQVSHHLICR